MKISELKKGTMVYYARCLPNVQMYEVLELKVRTIADTWFVGLEEKRDKHCYLFTDKDLDNTVFINRTDALQKVLEEELKNDDEEEWEIKL